MTLLTQLVRAEPALGATSTALAGVHRVGIVEPRPPGSAVLALTLGYGVTEGQVADEGVHHRLSDVLAGSVAPLPWLTAGVALSGRYDRHPGDERGSDDGWILGSALTARAGTRIDDLRIGGELVGWLPGSEDAGRGLSALSCDAKLLFGWKPNEWTLATQAGYRWDRGRRTAREPERLRSGDRLALGLSDYDAVLLGVGGIWQHRRTELLAELTVDLLMGGGAPSVGESPWRVSSGVRQELLPQLRAGMLMEVSLSSRPVLNAASPLVPVDPRWSVLAGVAYELGATARPQASVVTPKHEVPVVGARSSEARATQTAPAPAPRSVRVHVVDDQGAPLKNAKVTLVLVDRTLELVADGDGNYRLEDAPAGSGRLRIEAAGFRAVERDLELGAGKPVELDVTVEPALPVGEVRGSVRSLDGRRIVATIRVEPLNVVTRTDSLGNFSVEVQPGRYQIVIEAPGASPQRREVQVERNGVVILTVELSAQ
jgi:hypothetical protein